MNKEIVTRLHSQGKFLNEAYYDYWLQVADIVEQDNAPLFEDIKAYLTEANKEQESKSVFADYAAYDDIYSMVVAGGAIITNREYETFGLVNIASYGGIENWDEVIDFSLAFTGPPWMTALIQSNIERVLRDNGKIPLQIHVLYQPTVKVFNLNLVADYKVRVYYHNAFVVDDVAAIVVAVLLVLAMIGAIVAIRMITTSKIAQEENDTQRVKLTTDVQQALLKQSDAYLNAAANPNLTPEERQRLIDAAAAASNAAGASLVQAVKNQGLPPSLGEQVSAIGNTLVKVAIWAGVAYLAIQFLPTLIPPAREKLKRGLA